MQADAIDITFRPVSRSDLPMLSDWMETAHWRKWWGDPDEELGFIRDMIDGKDTTQPFVFEVGGEPLGYIQYWFVGEHQTETWATDNPWLMEFSPETIGVDLSIGPADRLSRGLGSTALREFARARVEDGYRTIIIDPDPGNDRAIRAYEKAGFRPIERLRGKYADVHLMQYELNEQELNR